MQYVRRTIAAAVFLLLTFLFGWMLLRAPAEIFFRYRTAHPARIEFHSSQSLDRKIGKKAYPVELIPSPDGSVREFRVTVPLACLRKFRLDLPPDTELDLLSGGYHAHGYLRRDLTGADLLSGKARGGARMVCVLAPETAVPKHPRVQTGSESGTWEGNLTNDLPRLLGLLPALAAGIAGALFFLLLTGPRRRESLKYLLAGEFVLLLFGGTIAAGLTGGFQGKPELDLWSLAEYPARFSAWYKRHLPFRNEWFGLYYRFCSLCGISPVKDVFPGQEDWLFIGHFTRQTPYEDYLGVNLFTERELQDILRRLVRAQSLLKEKNIRFALFIAPGKMSVYGDRLRPEYQRRDPTGPTRARQLVEYIRKNSSIPVDYPLDELRAARKLHQVPLYYRHDTHWNFIGGYWGARAMLRLIDPSVRLPEPESLTVYADGMRRGDLARMIEAPENLREPEWKFRHPDLRYSDFPNLAGFNRIPGRYADGKRVFFIRDSFLSHAMPTLISRLSEVAVYWDYSLNMDLIEREKPDIVVLQVVDRYLGQLLHFGETSVVMESGGQML